MSETEIEGFAGRCVEWVQTHTAPGDSDSAKKKNLFKFVQVELAALLGSNETWRRALRASVAKLRRKFIRKLHKRTWFDQASGWGFTPQDLKQVFDREAKQILAGGGAHSGADGRGGAADSSHQHAASSPRPLRPELKEEQVVTKQEGTAPGLSERTNYRRRAGDMAMLWANFNKRLVRDYPGERRWAKGGLDLSKAPNRNNHWLFKTYRAFEQVFETIPRIAHKVQRPKLSPRNEQPGGGQQWKYSGSVYGVVQHQEIKALSAETGQKKEAHGLNRLPVSQMHWSKFLLEFFSRPSNTLEREMPRVIRQLRSSVFTCPVQRVRGGGEETKGLRVQVAQLLNSPCWPPLWLTCWVGHLLLLQEDKQWVREPQRLSVELNEKGTYFYYDQQGWQDHWAENREGLAPASRGVLCCAWDVRSGFLSVFAPAPALWSCRLARVYLLKKGRELAGQTPSHGDLYLASKNQSLKIGSVNTQGETCPLTPCLPAFSYRAMGRMGVLHDLHSGPFWKQSLALLFLHTMEKHSSQEVRSPGSRALPLILPVWFATFPSEFLVYFNEALSGDTRSSEFHSLNAAVLMSTRALPMLLLSLALSLVQTQELRSGLSWKQVERASSFRDLLPAGAGSRPPATPATDPPRVEQLIFLGEKCVCKWFPASRGLVLRYRNQLLALDTDRSRARPVLVVAHCREHARFLREFLTKHLSFFLGPEGVRQVDYDARTRAKEPNLLCRLNLAEDLGVGRTVTPKEKQFDEVDLFTCDVESPGTACVYTLPLEALHLLVDPTRRHLPRDPALVLFWGVNSLVNVELNAADIWKQKRLAYHFFEVLGRDDIPRVMIIEPYYIDHSKDLKQQTYRKIIRSCSVARFLLHFVVAKEASKCQKIRGTAAGKGSTCFSKSFLNCESPKKINEEVWKRTQDKVVARTFSVPLRLKDAVRSPGNDLGNVCFVVYDELSPLCHENMKPLWNKLNSDRDKKVFLNLCFGEPLSVVWSTRHKAHQVYKLCSQGMGEAEGQGRVKNFKPDESEVGRLLEHSDWIINSGLRIAVSCVIHQALLNGVCILNVEERHSCQTVPPLLSFCLSKLKKHLEQQRQVTLVDLSVLRSQIYEQNSLWTPLSQSNLHNFESYSENPQAREQKLEDTGTNLRFAHYKPNPAPRPAAAQQSNHPVRLTSCLRVTGQDGQEARAVLTGRTSRACREALAQAGCLARRKEEGSSPPGECTHDLSLRNLSSGAPLFVATDFQSPMFEKVLACLSQWRPGGAELLALYQAFCCADPHCLKPATFRLCRLLFEKTSLRQLCCLLNWCWLMDFGDLLQVLCMALTMGQLSPLYANRDAYQATMCRDNRTGLARGGLVLPASPSVSPTSSAASPPLRQHSHTHRSSSDLQNTPHIQAEENIRTTIDDASMHFAHKKRQYQLLGRRLWEHGLLSSTSYSNRGTDEFWRDPDLAFCSVDSTLRFLVSTGAAPGEHPRTVVYTKEGSLNLIDTVLTSQGHRKALTLRNHTYLWVVESNLLPNGTRLSTTAVSVPLSLGTIIHSKIPLDRFTGPVFMPLPSRFCRQLDIHRSFSWDMREALVGRQSLQQYSKLVGDKLTFKLDPRHLGNLPNSIKKSVALYPPVFFSPFRPVSVQQNFAQQKQKLEEKMLNSQSTKIVSKRGRKRRKKATTNPGTAHEKLFQEFAPPGGLDFLANRSAGQAVKKRTRDEMAGAPPEDNESSLPPLPRIFAPPAPPATQQTNDLAAPEGALSSVLERTDDPTKPVVSDLTMAFLENLEQSRDVTDREATGQVPLGAGEETQSFGAFSKMMHNLSSNPQTPTNVFTSWLK